MSGRGAWIVGLALCACRWPNPDFDPLGESGTGQGSGSGVTTSTSSQGPTGSAGSATMVTDGSASMGATGVTDGVSAGSTTSGGETGSTSLQMQCAAEGMQCGDNTPCCGTCLTCDMGVCASNCPVCQVCAPGGCGVNPGAACDLAPGERCEDLIWGITPQGCTAYAPSSGACDNSGVCLGNCVAPGAVLAGGECSAECVLDPSTCQQGTAVSEFSGPQFCAHNTMTSQCTQTCVNGMGESTLSYLSCDAVGQCVGSMMSCGPYACDGDFDNCRDSCSGAQDCAPGHMCSGMVCL